MTAKKSKKAASKTAKAKNAKKEGTRVSTILEVRGAGKKSASSKRRNTARDGKKA
jgi:hypothetical protein